MAVGIISSEIDFNEILNSNAYSIVDFFAGWCGPCRMLAPNFETVSEEINAASFFKLNTDELQKLAQKYNVMSIPTIIIYKKNNEIARLSGYMSVDDLKKKILKVIK